MSADAQVILVVYADEYLKLGSYHTFKNLDDCLEALRRFPAAYLSIYPEEWGTKSVFDYLDNIAKILCLIYNGGMYAYERREKEWIIQQLCDFINRNADG